MTKPIEKTMRAPQWMPIETAPKDGTLIDALLDNGKRIPDCYWVHNEPAEGWWGYYGRLRAAPTHWMPLPTPPKESK